MRKIREPRPTMTTSRPSSRGSARSSRLARLCSGRTRPRAPHDGAGDVAPPSSAVSRHSSMSLSSLSGAATRNSTPSDSQSGPVARGERVEVTDHDIGHETGRQHVGRATIGRDHQRALGSRSSAWQAGTPRHRRRRRRARLWERPWNETTSVWCGTEVAASTPFAGTNRIRFRGSAVVRTLSARWRSPVPYAIGT